jgi:hypothetical protein
MVRVQTNEKHITYALNGVENGDELSAVIGGNHVRGNVLESRENVEGHDIEVVLDNGYTLYSDYTGEDKGSASTSRRDYHVFATTEDTDCGTNIEAVADWSEGMDAPDKGLDALNDEHREEMVEEMEDALDSISRALTELQAVRNGYRSILNGEMTIAEFEEELTVLELESGGTLALDDW